MVVESLDPAELGVAANSANSADGDGGPSSASGCRTSDDDASSVTL